MDEDKKYSVLVVDDDPNSILMLSFILKHEYTVYAVKCGEDAFDMIDQIVPDIILLDILMPKMDGYEVLNKLKSDNKTKDIPVIFITGLSEADDEEKGLRMGAADYITKPFSTAIVKLRVSQQINFINQLISMYDRDLEDRNNCLRLELISRIGNDLAKGNHDDLNQDDLNIVTNNLLSLTGKKENPFELIMSEFSLNLMLYNIIKQRQYKIESRISSEIPKSLIGDKERITLVIENILACIYYRVSVKSKLIFSAEMLSKDDDSINIQIKLAAEGRLLLKHKNHSCSFTVLEYLLNLMGGSINVHDVSNTGMEIGFTYRLGYEK